MTGQMDLSEARLARDEAISRVAAHAPESWMEEAERAIRWCAIGKDLFTTDDVFAFLSAGEVENPHEPRAMGAAMQKAQREGWIEPTGSFRITSRRSRHAAPIRVWRSLIRDVR